MAAEPLSTDCLSTSTPIQQHHGSRFRSCKRYITSPVKGFDLLSPIKKIFPFRRNLFDNSNVTDNNTPNAKINKKNQSFRKVEIVFKITEQSNIIDAGKFDNDSGIESDRNSTSEDQSIFDKLTSFPTDENCNVISNCDTPNGNSYNQLSKSFNLNFLHDNDVEYSKSEKIFECLDNRSKITHDKQNSISSFDILSELNLRNCSAVLSLILSYLPDEELRKASYICKEWQDIIFSDKKSYERRAAYIKKKKDIAAGPEKENRFHTKHVAERSHKSVFLSIINSQSEESQQPLVFTESVGKFDSFIKETQNLSNDEMLIKCPKCLYPSKSESGNKYCCTRKLCQHMFCKKCMGPYLNSHRCSIPKLNATVPSVIIGNKQSKKNLRRL